jgi:hypothetical protein
MQHVEMRDYCGDYEDVAELWDRVWVPEYGGKMWMTVADAAFFRWLVGPNTGRCVRSRMTGRSSSATAAGRHRAGIGIRQRDLLVWCGEHLHLENSRRCISSFSFSASAAE